MELSEIKPKTRVKVTIEGTVQSVTDDEIYLKSDDGYVSEITYSGSTVFTVAEPEGWGPEPGDIWEADGKEYYVSENSSGTLYIAPFDGKSYYYYYCNNPKNYPRSFDAFLKLNPKLVRRRSK
jgi:hypothetical protein